MSMENQMGKSILKASIILSITLIICMVIYVANNRSRYTPMGDKFYIDQRTGKTYTVLGKALN